MSPAMQSSGQYLQGAYHFSLETRSLPEPAADEVQVIPRSTTLCGSDLHYYHHYRNGSIQVREPLCLGHESAGEVVGLGSGVAKINPSIAIGDRVALEVGVACGQCSNCEHGRYNICPALRFRGSGAKFPHFQGTLQTCINHPVRWVHKIPDSLDYEVGALLEPLAVAIHAVRRANDTRSSLSTEQLDCLIFGAGAVGLLCAVTAKAQGYRNIGMVDIDAGRLQFALENGFASSIYQVQSRRGQAIEEKLSIAKDTAEDIGKVEWKDGMPIGQVDRVFECTGVESCLQASIYVSDIPPCFY